MFGVFCLYGPMTANGSVIIEMDIVHVDQCYYEYFIFFHIATFRCEKLKLNFAISPIYPTLIISALGSETLSCSISRNSS